LRVRLGVLKTCPAASSIDYHISGTFAAGTAATSGTIASYAAGTSTTNFQCGVNVIDSAGVVAALTTSSRPSTTSLIGTLFSSSSGSASFGATSITYDGATASAAAPTAGASVMSVVALAVAIAAARFAL